MNSRSPQRRAVLVERTNSTDDLCEMLKAPFPTTNIRKAARALDEEKKNRRSTTTQKASVRFAPDEIITCSSSASAATLQDEPSAVVASSSQHYSACSWLEDASLETTMVYRKRLKRAAIPVQALVRGFLQRRRYPKALELRQQKKEQRRLDQAAVVIQTAVRQRRALLDKAATAMQSIVRAFVARLRVQVVRLEDRLQQIHDRRDRQLRKIAKHTKRERQRIDDELQKEFDLQQRRAARKLEKNNYIIRDMRQQNRILRKQNDTLREATDIMVAKNLENVALYKKTQKNMARLQRALPKLEQDTVEFQKICQQYEARIAEYQNSVEHHDAKKEYEIAVTKLAKTTIDQLLVQIRSGCSDKELTSRIVQRAEQTMRQGVC